MTYLSLFFLQESYNQILFIGLPLLETFNTNLAPSLLAFKLALDEEFSISPRMFHL